MAVLVRAVDIRTSGWDGNLELADGPNLREPRSYVFLSGCVGGGETEDLLHISRSPSLDGRNTSKHIYARLFSLTVYCNMRG
jgi:hypothetical protein